MTGAIAAVIGSGRSVRVTVSPESASGAGGGNIVISNSVAVSVSGGAPTAYSWTQSSGDSVFALTPSSASTAFQAGGMASGESRSAIFVCAVTVNGVVYLTPEVSVTLERF